MRRLVLVGGGHAHVEVLRVAARAPMRGVEIALISPFARQLYSSTMPAQLREGGAEEPRAFDLVSLCKGANARFIEGSADRVVPGEHPVVYAAGKTLECDALSLDIGSVPAALATSGVGEHAFAIRPLLCWRDLLTRIAELTRRGGTVPCCVVGGGAAGIELALALEHRLRASGVHGRVSLVDAAQRLMPGIPERVSARVVAILAARGITIHTGESVSGVDSEGVALGDGRRVESVLTIWATGAAAPPLIGQSALPTDSDGYLLVDEMLQSTDGSPIWGAGDCVAMAHAPWAPKSGVIAVRAAPILAHNLRAAVEGGTMRRYHPQRHAMAILDTSDERGLLIWRSLTSHSRWALTLKSLIDRRFLARYSAIS